MPDDVSPHEPYIPEELRLVADQVHRGEPPPKISVRQLLQYFGFQRRGFIKTFIMQEALDTLSIATEPNFVDVWIDAEIGFIPKKAENTASIKPSILINESTIFPIKIEEITASTVTDTYDPTYRIGLLAAANQAIVSVNPDDALATAVTRMLHNDFSQLPVMRTDRDLKGMISWASVGSRMALSQTCEKVRDCMDAC
jgi:CBS domain-containing protein